MFKKPFRITELKTDNSEMSIQKYFNDIRNLDCDETELYDGLIKKDPIAIKKLIECNTKFVVSVAKKYHNKRLKLSLNDLVEEGNIGLVESANRFDPRHGVKFITFAVSYIRKYILIALNENGHSFSLPSGRISDVNKLKNEIDVYEKNLERELSHYEAVIIFGDSFSDITIDTYYTTYSKSLKSLNDPISNSELNENEEFINCLEDKSEEIDYDIKFMGDKLVNIINKLTDQEKILINLISGDTLGFDHKDKYIKTVLGLSEKKYQNFKVDTLNKIKKQLV